MGAASDTETLSTHDELAPSRPSDRDFPIVDARFYDVQEEVARGGWGRILRAFDRRLGRMVAIKQLRVSSELVEARLRREARLTARLEHPSIVPVHEVGRFPSGEPFYVMKLVEGRSLHEVLAGARTLDERLPLLPHVLAVADAMAYAHAKGVIHRDLKPSNVMVGAFGETLVIDWGLAKEIGAAGAVEAGDGDGDSDAPEAASNDMTLAGSVVGTPPWLPPEQARGEPVDARADVYALGAMLYTLVAGRAPYEGESSAKILVRVLSEPVEPVTRVEPSAPTDLIAVVDKAMARDPGRRYADAGELADDLRRFLTGKLVAAHRYSTSVLVRRWLRAHRRAVAVVAAVVLLGVALLVGARRLRTAQAVAETRRGELTLARARTELERDPTAAVAMLKRYTAAGGTDDDQLELIAAEAEGRSVARHVLWGMQRASIGRDGNTVAGFQGRYVRLFRLDTGVLRRLEDPDGEPHHLRFAPDGASFATVDSGRVLRLWSVAGGESKRLFHADRDLVWVDFSPDGRFVAVSDDAGAIHRVDLATGAVLSRSGKGTLPIFAFSPDGDDIAVTGSGAIYLFVGDAREPTMLGATGSYEWVTAAPEGNRIGWGTRAGEIVIADLPDRGAGAAGAGAAAPTPRVVGSQGAPVMRLAFTHDAARIAACSTDGSVRLWDVATGESRVLSGPGEPALRLALSPDDRFLAASGATGDIRLWTLETGGLRTLHGDAHAIQRVQFSPDGGVLLSSDNVGQTRLWPLAAAPARIIDRRREGGAVAAGGGVVAMRSEAGITVWAASAATARTIPLPASTSLELALSPDGSHAAAIDGSRVRVVDLGRGEVAAIDTAATMRGIALAPDGRTVAVSDDDYDVLLLAADGATAPRELHGPDEVIELLRFSPDGRQLAGVGAGVVWLWNLGDPTAQHLRSPEAIRSLAFSPDGSRIAMVLASGRIWLWSPADGTQRDLRGHSADVTALAFSPDGATLATAGEDQAVWLWDAATGRGRRLRHFAPVRAVTFLADGSQLATCGDDGSVRLWDVAGARELAVLPVTEQPLLELFHTGGALFAADAEHLWRVTPATSAHASLAAMTTAELLPGPDEVLSTPGAGP